MVSVMDGPIYVAWHYTYRCNLRCSHCYSRSAEYPAELDTQAYQEVADQIIDSGAFVVALGGGEPLLRADCYDMISRLADASVDTHLTTNGWNVDGAVASRLVNAGLGRLNISIDGPDASTHDAIRTPGAFDRALRAAKVASAHQIPLYFSTVIMAQNVDALDGIIRIAEEHSVKAIHLKRFRTAGNGMVNANKHLISAAAESQLKQRVAALAENTDVELSFTYFEGVPDPAGENPECHCGKTSICVRPNGDVSPCAYGESILGNLRTSRLRDIWVGSPALTHMRNGGGCIGLDMHVSPMNPSQPSLSLAAF